MVAFAAELNPRNGRMTTEVINARQEHASGIIVEGLRNSGAYSGYGLMGGGKTGLLGKIREQIPDLIMFKLNANRAGEQDNTIWKRDGEPITGDVRPVPFAGLGEVINQMQDGRVPKGRPFSITEAQFVAANPAQLETMYKLARQNGNGVFMDCLVSWFDGQAHENTELIVHQSEAAFYMQGWDDFTGEPSDFTVRLVGIHDGDVINAHAEDTYYRSLGRKARVRIASNLDASNFGKSLLMKEPDGSDVDECIGVPSWHNDERFAIGSDRYRAASLSTYRGLYTMAEINLNGAELIPGSQLFPHANKETWR